MSRATPELVKQVLSTNPVDRLSAEDLNTGARLFYVEGNGAELCAGVDQVDAMMMAPYRLRAWSSRVDGKRGNKPVQDRPFEWILSGRSGWPTGGAPAPVPATPPAPASAAVNGLDKGELKEWAQAVAERDAMAAKMAEMEQRLRDLESDDGDDDDDEPVNGAPVSFWNSEAGTAMVKELSGSLSAFLRAKAATLNGNAPKVGAPAAPAPDAAQVEGLTPDELRAVQALRDIAAVRPDDVAMYLHALQAEHEKIKGDGQG